MNYLIEFGDGRHGILPNEDIEYSVSRGRVILYKNGEKVLDKEITDCPSGKCEILCNKDSLPDVRVMPVDGEVINKMDVPPDGKISSEYNVGNMLPQIGLEEPIVQKDTTVEEFKVTDNHNTGFLEDFIKDCKDKLNILKDSHVPDTDPRIQEIKARMWSAEKKLKAYTPHLVAASDNSVETDGELVTESISGDAVKAGAIAVGGFVALVEAFKGIVRLGEMGADKIVTAAQRPKYKKVLDAYYNYFMVDKAPKFANLKKTKCFTTEVGDKKNAVLGILQKYGLGTEFALVTYSYKDEDICACYMNKKYKASFDVFTFVINGGDVIKIDYGWTKHLQTKVLKYKKFENYYAAYMHLMLGFIDNPFKDIVREVNDEIKKHKKELDDIKKESTDIDDTVSLTLTESAINFINGENINLTESAKDVILNYETDCNVSRRIRVLIIEIAILQAKLNKMGNDAKPEKVASIKKDIIAKEKEKRKLLEGQTQEVKDAVKRIEKAAVKEARKEVLKDKDTKEDNKEEVKEESVVDVVPLVEEKPEEPPQVVRYRAKIDKLKDRLSTMEKEPRVHKSEIEVTKEEITKLNGFIYNILSKSKKVEPSDEEKAAVAEESTRTRSIKEMAMDKYRDIMSSFVNEAANIDEAIKDIIYLLNSKGYHTRYSSAGHYHLRKKEDKEPDGVFYGKLYSDARVQFKGTYNFGAAPKYWMWKKVDGDDYLDIIPLIYKDSDGTPDEAFDKWRTNYLNSLEQWAKKLPNAESKKNDDPTPITKGIKEESAQIGAEFDNYIDSIFRENGIR